MPLPHKPGPAQSVTIVGQIPDLPKLPEQFVDRFKELEQYDAEMERWWQRFGDMLQRDLDDINLLAAKVTALEAAVQKLSSS